MSYGSALAAVVTGVERILSAEAAGSRQQRGGGGRVCPV